MTASLYPADFYGNRRAHTEYAARALFAALPAPTYTETRRQTTRDRI